MESCTWYPVRDLSIWYFKLQPYVVMADLVFYGGPCPTQQNWFWDSDKLTCVHILKLVPANFIRNTWSSFWGVFTWNVFCLISQNASLRAHTLINSATVVRLLPSSRAYANPRLSGRPIARFRLDWWCQCPPPEVEHLSPYASETSGSYYIPGYLQGLA